MSFAYQLNFLVFYWWHEQKKVREHNILNLMINFNEMCILFTMTIAMWLCETTVNERISYVWVNVWICLYYLLMWLFCNSLGYCCWWTVEMFFDALYFKRAILFDNVLKCFASVCAYVCVCVCCYSFPYFSLSSIAKWWIKCKCGYSISKHEIVKCINIQYLTKHEQQ